jgi:predicted nucleic acid-binding protein
MVSKAFVDTNVLLRAMTPAMELHAEAEKLIQEQWDHNVELWLSRQIIREYLVQVTRPQAFMRPLSANQIDGQVQTIESLFRIAEDGPSVTAQLVELIRRYPTGGKQIHDANIVATMLVHGIPTLITTNLEDMQRFADRISLIHLNSL